MAEPTTTLTALRRSIASVFQTEFFRRYPESVLAVTTASTSSSFTCSSLGQTETDFWKGAFVYFVTATQAAIVGKERKVSAFTPATDTITFVEPYPAVITAADTFEIHAMASANDIHRAINRAIRDVAKAYPRSVIDETLVVREKRRIHTITGLSARCWVPKQVYVENNSTATHSLVTSVTYSGPVAGVYTATIVLKDLTVTTDQYNGWLCSAVTGTGEGGIAAQTISDTIAPHTIVVTSTVNTFDTTTLLMLWNTAVQEENWDRLTAVRFDFNEYPNTMWMQEQLDMYRGFRLRFIYTAAAAELTAEADVTTVPQEYVINKSLQFLHETLAHDNRSDANRHLNLAQYYSNEAEKFLVKNAPQRPSGTAWQEGDDRSDNTTPDPLSWR